MKALRFALSAFVVVGLVAGYLASQVAYFRGQAPDYAARVDSPQVAMLALVLLGAAVVLSLVKDREEP